jgi:hypothetical protein
MATNVANGEWQLSDASDFRVGLDEAESYCVYLKSIAARPKDFGFICKKLDAADHIGKGLRFSASVKTRLPEGASAQLWLRVDGDWKSRPANSFNNMYKQRIIGDSAWESYSVEVEVPNGSKEIVYGILLNGTGQVWLDEPKLENPQQ